MSAMIGRLVISMLAIGWVAGVPAWAQSNGAGDRPKYNVGGGVSLFFRAKTESQPAIPLPSSVWFTASAGRFGFQVDWIRGVWNRPPHYQRYFLTSGGEERQYFDAAWEEHHVDQVFGAALKWSLPRVVEGFYLVFGVARTNYTDRTCVAFSWDDPPEHGARVDHPPGFDCSREPVDYTERWWIPTYGLGVDFPLGSRYFGTVQYRAMATPWMGDLRVGAGFRW